MLYEVIERVPVTCLPLYLRAAVGEEEVAQADWHSGCLISRPMLRLGFAAALDDQKSSDIREIESSVLQEK